MTQTSEQSSPSSEPLSPPLAPPPLAPPAPEIGASVDYCDVEYSIPTGSRLTIGRDADLVIDDNQFLHRVFLTVDSVDGYWVLHNVGSQLGATVSDTQGRFEAFLAPGASLPLVFDRTIVTFTAGPTTYEFAIVLSEQPYSTPAFDSEASGETTVGPVRLTFDQQLLVLALAEPRLRRGSTMSINLPSSPEAARRLDWSASKFNRKLDNVCDKLTKLGVRGLQGDLASYASNRKSRLVEYAVATRLVTAADLDVLDDYLASLPESHSDEVAL